MPPAEDTAELANAKRRGKRLMMALFVGFAAAYILLSTWEVIAGVFGLDAPGQMAAHGKPDEACAKALRDFGSAVDRGNDGNAESAAADGVCQRSGADLDALAAVHRFERARAAASRQANAPGGAAPAIIPLRRDLQAYLEP